MENAQITVRHAVVGDAGIVEKFNARLADELEGVILDHDVFMEGVRRVLSDQQNSHGTNSPLNKASMGTFAPCYPPTA